MAPPAALEGVYVPAVTPLYQGGHVDEAALERVGNGSRAARSVTTGASSALRPAPRSGSKHVACRRSTATSGFPEKVGAEALACPCR